jgi:hypothetical protein
VVCLGGGSAVAGQLEQVTADRWNAVAGRQAAVLLHLGQQLEAGLRAFEHRERDRAVQCEDGVGGDLLEQLVQCRDLAPVGLGRARRFGVDGRDCGLELERADRTRRECPFGERHTLGDQPS